VVPVSVPVVGNADLQTVSPPGLEVKFEYFCGGLDNSKLVCAFGQVVVDLRQPFGFYPEFYGNGLTIEVQLRMAVKFHPVVVAGKP
jgi:hypothetical protein